MEENVQHNDDGLSIIYIIRLLFSKIKWLILACLIGGFLGGVFGIVHTYDMKYYGTSVEFYVSPEKSTTSTSSTTNSSSNSTGSQYGVYGAYGSYVMDTMINLLDSDSFTEQLMLEDNGLPSMELYSNLTQSNYTAAEAAIQKVNAEWAKVENWNTAKAAKLEALNDRWNAESYDDVFGPFSKNTYVKVMQNNSVSIPDDLKSLYQEYTAIEDNYDVAYKAANAVQKETDAVVEVLLEEWRALPKYRTYLKKYQSVISYSYLDDEVDLADSNYLARSFIYVDINILNDEEFAKDLLVRVKRSVPAYIEQNMFVPPDYEGTSCTRITRNDDIHRTNPNYRAKQTIKYAILAAMVAGVVAAGFIIVLDSQDKRLRDYEVITKSLNVPVLGIIPTIEELAQSSEMKEQQNKEVK